MSEPYLSGMREFYATSQSIILVSSMRSRLFSLIFFQRNFLLTLEDISKERSIANIGGLDGASPKSNKELRGLTKSILLKGLSAKARYVHFKKSLPVTPKNVTLSTRLGLKNALLTFSTEEDCSKAFDVLESFTYDGRKAGLQLLKPKYHQRVHVFICAFVSPCL